MFNIVRLTAADVLTHWQLVRMAVSNSLPPTFVGSVEASMNPILDDMKAGRLQVWVVFDESGPVHLTVTQLNVNSYNHASSMLVFAWWSIRGDISRECLEYSVEKLRQYAQTNGCQMIEFYTDADNLAQMFQERYGATVRKYVTVEVNHD